MTYVTLPRASKVNGFAKAFLCVAVPVLLCQGCSVYMAATQPDRKDPEFFREGANRHQLLATYGQPIASEVSQDGKKQEVYKFVDGYSLPVRVGRVVWHGVADIATLCIWELLGIPLELAFNGTPYVFSVTFDENNRATEVKPLAH